MKKVKVVESGVIYENPLPNLRSRHAYFPSVLQLPDKSIIVDYVVGEAFESVDLTTNISRSYDMGKTWGNTCEMYVKTQKKILTSDMLKISHVSGNDLIAFGYEFFRNDINIPIGNTKTGGVLDNQVIFITSGDLGETWSEPRNIKTSFNGPVEASAPITILKDGSWVTPIANMPDWEGRIDEGFCGRLLRSRDKGITWEDETITMRFPKKGTTVFEQRICVTEGGNIVLIAWNEDSTNGMNYCNHFTISINGYSFTEPKPTGIMGQASSLTSIGGEEILALHCIRKETNKPGIYAYIVDVSKNIWDIESEEVIWEPNQPVIKDNTMAEIFSYLKFGQPTAIRLSDGSFFMTHWAIENGQGRIIWTKFIIEESMI